MHPSPGVLHGLTAPLGNLAPASALVFSDLDGTLLDGKPTVLTQPIRRWNCSAGAGFL